MITELCNSLTSLVQSFMAKGALLKLSSTLSSHSLKVFSGEDSIIHYLPIHKTLLNFWKAKARVSFSWPVTFHLLLYLLHTHSCSPFFFFPYAEVQGYTVESCSQSHSPILQQWILVCEEKFHGTGTTQKVHTILNSCNDIDFSRWSIMYYINCQY